MARQAVGWRDEVSIETPALQTPAASNPSQAAIWLVPALFAALFVYPLSLPTPLLDPDEGLRAVIAQEMVDRGDWLVPRLFGEPFLDNPAFYFWCEALSLRLFGYHEAAVRLPGLLFGALGALTTGLLGRQTLGRGAGWLAAALYATMFLPLALCQAAAPDVALVPWVNLALLSLWQSEGLSGLATAGGAMPSGRREGGRPTFSVTDFRPGWLSAKEWASPRTLQAAWVASAGVFMGMAILTKGLFGIALIVVAFGGFLLVSRRLTAWVLLRGFLAVALGACIAAVWYLPMERANPGFLHYFFIDRHFLGMVGGTQRHGQEPWWYYLPVLLLGGLPWVGYVPALATDWWVRGRGDQHDDGEAAHNDAPQRRLAVMFFATWLVACTLLLSVAGSKMVTYAWPLFPAVALLATEVWRRLLAGRMSAPAAAAVRRTLQFSVLSSPLVFPLAVAVVQFMLEVELGLAQWLAVAAAAAVPLAILPTLRGGDWRRLLGMSIGATAIQFVLLMTFVMPAVGDEVSSRELAGHFNRLGRVPHCLRFVDERVGSIVFYLEPELRAGLRPYQIARIGVKETPYAAAGTVLVVPDRKQPLARRWFDIDRLTYETVDRFRVYEPLPDEVISYRVQPEQLPPEKKRRVNRR